MDGSTLIQPDRAIADAFVRAFTAHDAMPGAVRLRFIHDRERGASAIEREGILAQLWPEIVQFQGEGYGTYYFLNEIARGPGTGRNGMATDTDVTRVRCLGIDCDHGLLEPWELHQPASFIVCTSIKDGVQRGQILWLTATTAIADFRECQQRLAHHYETDPQVCNPSRVFRLPGSLHLKREPSLVVQK